MSGPLALLYPVMAQVLLTLLVLLWSGRARVTALKERRARLAEIALSSAAWPDDVRKISNNAQNQFETPILFFVLCGAATYIGETGLMMTLLAWAYIATRLAHTFIHTTTNRVQHRFAAFATGIAVLAVMWVVVAARLLAA
jgi:hypothetical protein